MSSVRSAKIGNSVVPRVEKKLDVAVVPATLRMSGWPATNRTPSAISLCSGRRFSGSAATSVSRMRERLINDTMYDSESTTIRPGALMIVSSAPAMAGPPIRETCAVASSVELAGPTCSGLTSRGM